MSSPDSTVALNNYLQTIGMTAALSWQESHKGPRHAPVWTVSCIMDGDVVATGTGTTKTAAKDAAAKAALAVLATPEAPEGQIAAAE